MQYLSIYCSNKENREIECKYYIKLIKIIGLVVIFLALIIFVPYLIGALINYITNGKENIEKDKDKIKYGIEYNNYWDMYVYGIFAIIKLCILSISYMIMYSSCFCDSDPSRRYCCSNPLIETITWILSILQAIFLTPLIYFITTNDLTCFENYVNYLLCKPKSIYANFIILIPISVVLIISFIRYRCYLIKVKVKEMIKEENKNVS